MTKQIVNIGVANKGNGDPIRTAFDKVNQNFTELYNAIGLGDGSLNIGAFEFTGSTMTTTDSSDIIIAQRTQITSNLTVAGSILPSVANGGDLGSAAKPWSSLYVSNSTIYLGNHTLSINDQGELTYNGNRVAHEAGEFMTLDNLSNVNSSNPSNGDVLTWAGSFWTHATPDGLGNLKTQSSVSTVTLGTKDNPDTGGWGGYDLYIDSGNNSDAKIYIPGVNNQAANMPLQIFNNALATSIIQLFGRGGVQVVTNNGVNEKVFEFADNGTLIFPDGSLALTDSVLNNGLDADIKGSVFADDSTIMVDGVSGVLRANVNVANTWTVTTGDKTWSFIYGDVSLGTNPIFEFPGSLQAVGSQTGIYAPADDLSGNWGMSIDAANSPYNVDIGEISGSNYWRFSGDGILYLPSIGGGGGAILRSPLNESIGLSVYNDTGAGATYTLSVATTGPINIPTASTGLGRLQNPDGIEILTNSGATAKMWSFGTDGKLTVPGIIELSNGAQIFNTAGVDDSITIGATGNPGTITFNGSGFFNDDTFFHKAIQEKFSSLQDATGVVTHNCANGHIFYHTSPDANWTVNLTNFSLVTNYATAITIIISQGGTGYYPNALQIDGAAHTINWQGNTTPTPSSNRVDVVTFSIFLTGSSYTVLGQLTGF